MSIGLAYLHGFASGLNSYKAQYLRHNLGSAWQVRVADLEGGDFSSLTIPTMLDRAERCIANLLEQCEQVVVVGSSLGGYLAAYGASSWAHASRWAGLLLLAPAFRFLPQWTERLGPQFFRIWQDQGVQQFYHYGDKTEKDLHYSFFQSCRDYPLLPASHTVPVRIIHGHMDEVVAIDGSEAYLDQLGHGTLLARPSDHSLSSDEDLTCMVAQCHAFITDLDT